jgi:hypothetical protein
MTVANLIGRLQKMNPELPVWVSDGTDCRFYSLDETVTIEEFVGLDDGEIVCDIGVGYCRED